MLYQFESQSDLLIIGFHFFLFGLLVGIALMRIPLRQLKKQVRTLNRELEKEYEYNAMPLDK